MIRESKLGLMHIYYGSGVGKTTKAVGLAIRAAGTGLHVDFVQFMKSGNSGEVAIFGKTPNIDYWCPGKHPFILSRGPDTVHYEHAQKALGYALEAIERGTDLLICDEMLDTILFNLLERERILKLMEKCKNKVELVMTGRDASPEIIEAADYVTEFVQKKHPYYSGTRARKGIEY
ncbi:cob(I)yrinic acid a,c-diamide adenosyltransferase [bacterium]|nr:cob(I)yrinic acid a,c-diamide adenosyltransferase [bacterium]